MPRFNFPRLEKQRTSVRTSVRTARLLIERLEPRQMFAVAAPGLRISEIAVGLRNPVAMTFLPDGRALVVEQAGTLRVIKNGVLLEAPAYQTEVDLVGERGLLGVVADPDFQNTGFIYLYRTVPSNGESYNQVFRLTFEREGEGDRVIEGSEEVLMDLPPLSDATNHNGGALTFGNDGKLYIAVGDNARTANSPSLETPLGKVLRINRDGSIPTDNPFYDRTEGVNRAIWARGFRNPFTFAVRRTDGAIYINDVGSTSDRAREEINVGVAGGNFGWPATEGYTSAAGVQSPVFAYAKSTSEITGEITGNAIAGAAFYQPAQSRLPSRFSNTFLFGDYSNGWIKALDQSVVPARVLPVADDLTQGAITDIDIAPDGSVWALNYASGFIYRIEGSDSAAPRISQQPADRAASMGERVTFSVAVASSGEPNYQWRRNDRSISGATGPTYTTPSLTAQDDGVRYSVAITNPFGRVVSRQAVLNVNTANNAPRPFISSPVNESLFRGNSIYTFSGGATDQESGAINAVGLSWKITYQTGSVVRPAFSQNGVASGQFTVPRRTPYAATNVLYRVALTARDEQGALRTTSVTLLPRTATITLQTVPRNGTVFFDGAPYSDGSQIQVVSGYKRDLAAPVSRGVDGQQRPFTRWNLGGARTQIINAPDVDRNIIAYFESPQGLVAAAFKSTTFRTDDGNADDVSSDVLS